MGRGKFKTKVGVTANLFSEEKLGRGKSKTKVGVTVNRFNEEKFVGGELVKKHSEFAGGEFLKKHHDADKEFDAEENENEEFDDADLKFAEEKIMEFIKKQPDRIEELLKKHREEELAEFIKNEKIAGGVKHGPSAGFSISSTKTELLVASPFFSVLLSRVTRFLTRSRSSDG